MWFSFWLQLLCSNTSHTYLCPSLCLTLFFCSVTLHPDFFFSPLVFICQGPPHAAITLLFSKALHLKLLLKWLWNYIWIIIEFSEWTPEWVFLKPEFKDYKRILRGFHMLPLWKRDLCISFLTSFINWNILNEWFHSPLVQCLQNQGSDCGLWWQIVFYFKVVVNWNIL